MYLVDTSRGMTERVCEDCGDPAGWSRNGTRILYLKGQPSHVEMLDLITGQKAVVLEDEKFNLGQAHFSPDDRWIVFAAETRPDRSCIFVAPFHDGAPIGRGAWIAVTDGATWDDKPEWLPSGDGLVFYSKRDGFGCIWIVHLERGTMRCAGPPRPLYHFHNNRLSLMHMSLPKLQLAVAQESIFFNLIEMSGNIWMAQFAGER